MPKRTQKQMSTALSANKEIIEKKLKENQELREKIKELEEYKVGDVLESADSLRQQIFRCKMQLRSTLEELKIRTQQLKECEKSRNDRGIIIKGLEMSLEHQKLLRLEAKRDATAKTKLLIDLAENREGKKEVKAEVAERL
ncbi:unnamed protein product [Caenorhabditis angaria]|uniref:Uncharacterized protein n=1 Tax=Caenorhabditis angaria TaxID=860376 RepID=A0A9P1IK87_9PELO|nr:unnamed protein product [Caenorhabditis angaria]